MKIEISAEEGSAGEGKQPPRSTTRNGGDSRPTRIRLLSSSLKFKSALAQAPFASPSLSYPKRN